MKGIKNLLEGFCWGVFITGTVWFCLMFYWVFTGNIIVDYGTKATTGEMLGTVALLMLYFGCCGALLNNIIEEDKKQQQSTTNKQTKTN